MGNRQFLTVVFAGLLALLPSAGALAGPMSADELFGYQTYLRLHPPKDKPVKYNLYPFPGPVIPFGQDIPLCAAARTAEAYGNKTELKYLTHGLKGWLFRTIDYRTDFTAAPATLDYFRRLNKALASKSQTLVVTFQPTRAMMSAAYLDSKEVPAGFTLAKAKEGYRAFLKQLQGEGIIAPDLSAAPNVGYFPKADFHWSPDGARDAARKVADAVSGIAAYRHIDRQDFASATEGLGPADRGAFEEFIQSTCKVNIQLTSEPLWKTVRIDGGGADDLLEDGAAPAITLLGTSNSSEDQKFNFAGSLRRYLHADVYNAAILGGGFGSSAARYYASDEYHEQPPKVVLWEFLPQHNYNNAESLASLRQMIPAVYGACAPEAALAQHKGQITAGKLSLFKGYGSSLRGTYLYLDAKAPLERSLKVEILYDNGEADQVDLTRSTRAANNGKYYLELGTGNASPLSFKIITDQPRGQIDARLCSYPTDMAVR